MNLEKYLIYMFLFFCSILILNIIISKYKIFSSKIYTSSLKQIKSILLILFIVIIIRSFIIEPFKIPSSSMNPTLLSGDFILANKFIYGIKTPLANKTIISINQPKRGDIIIFKHKNNMNYIKRIIGLPGDKITYKNKNLYINNIKIQNTYKGKYIDLNTNNIILELNFLKEYLTPEKEYNIYTHKNINYDNYKYFNIIIPNKSYFVLGDNRDNSEDSRYWGFVKEEKIIGKATIIWLSLDTELNDIRWNRLFKHIN